MTQPHPDADDATLMRQVITEAGELEVQLRSRRATYEAAKAEFDELVRRSDEELANGLAPARIQVELEEADRRLLHMEEEMEELISSIMSQWDVKSC